MRLAAFRNSFFKIFNCFQIFFNRQTGGRETLKDALASDDDTESISNRMDEAENILELHKYVDLDHATMLIIESLLYDLFILFEG